MKKFVFLTLLILATVLCTLVISNAVAPHAAAAAPVPGHPHIHEALESMRGARHHLEAAAAEFHGHRAKAIEHLDMAIHEAEICEHE